MAARLSPLGAHPPGAAARPIRRRRWLALAPLALIALLLAAPRLLCQPTVAAAIADSLLPGSSRSIQFDHVSAGWFRPIEATGIRYRSPGFELVADSLRCDRTLADLLRQPRDLGQVRIDAPQVTIDETKQAPSARTVPGGSRGRGRKAAPRVVSGAFECRHGTLRIVGTDRNDDWIAREIELRLTAPAASDTAEFELNARAGEATSTAHVSGQGRIGWPVRSIASCALEGQIEMAGIDARAISVLAGRWLREAKGEPAGWCISGPLTGSISFRRTSDETTEAEAQFHVESFAACETSSGLDLREPQADLRTIARLRDGSLRIDSLRLEAPSVQLSAAGTIRDLDGEASADLSGLVRCDWARIQQQLASLLPEGMSLSGDAATPWRFRGPLRATPGAEAARRVDADLCVHMDSLSLSGFQLTPLDLAAHCDNGVVRLEPISSPVGAGRMTAQLSVAIDRPVPLLSMAPGRVLDHVAIDSELCDLVLQYVHPLLAVPGTLHGRLSLELDRLELPLERACWQHGSLEGRLVLEDVQFTTADALCQVLEFAGVRADPSVCTSQTITVRLEDGRVYHTGLSLPLGDDRITIDGWAGIDHALDLVIDLPVTERMLGKDKRLYRVLHGQRIQLPVTGTLERPVVDEERLARNLQRLIQVALRDGIGRGGDDLLRGLFRKLK